MTTLHCTQRADRSALIERHEFLVGQVAHEFASKGGSKGYVERYEDFVSLLLVALVEAVDAFLAYAEVRNDLATRGYLATCLRSAVIDYHRTGKDDLLGRPDRADRGWARGLPVQSLDAVIPGCDDLTFADTLVDSGSEVSAERDYSVLYGALGALPVRQQEAVGVRFGFVGYGQEESMAALSRSRGIAEGTIAWRARKGVEKLRWELVGEVVA